MSKRKQVKLRGVIFEELFSRKEINQKVGDFAQKIMFNYQHSINHPVLLIVLNGGVYFGVDLSRALDKIGCRHAIDTISLKSYESDENGGAVKIVNYPRLNLEGRDVIVVEDVIDRGDTLNFLNKYLLGLKEAPHSIQYCTLLMKRNHAPLEFNLEYLPWTIGSEWIVGYGMDSGQVARGLSSIYVKKES